MQRRLLRLFLLCLLPLCTQAQGDEADWSYSAYANFGFNLYFYTGHGQKFPGWRAFGGVSLAAINKHNFLLNYGPTLSAYSAALGANLNPLVNDVQIDFANSFSAGGWLGDASGYIKPLRTIGNSAAYNLVLEQRNAVLLSTIFVFNNHRRNQSLGAITGTIGDFSFNYYNDGGFPISLLPIADQFDRYWTGGLGLFFHSNDGYNRAEFTFDQFTGYEPMLYEMSSLLGTRVPDYNLESVGDKQQRSKQSIPPNFNTSAYNLRIFPYRSFGLDAGAIGALRSENGRRVFGLQDIIHTMGRYAIHPNMDGTRFYLGGTYLNNMYVQP